MASPLLRKLSTYKPPIITTLTINMKKYHNIEIARQSKLFNEFGEFIQCYQESDFEKYQVLPISYFDHWLSEVEANELLQNASVNEQEKRYFLHRKFCGALINTTEVLSFKRFGRNKKSVKFRSFASNTHLLEYLAPKKSLNKFGDYAFVVLLPKLKMLFVGGFDNTNYVYCLGENNIPIIEKLASESGLHVLP
jgi:hypothetical protein